MVSLAGRKARSEASSTLGRVQNPWWCSLGARPSCFTRLRPPLAGSLKCPSVYFAAVSGRSCDRYGIVPLHDVLYASSRHTQIVTFPPCLPRGRFVARPRVTGHKPHPPSRMPVPRTSLVPNSTVNPARPPRLSVRAGQSRRGEMMYATACVTSAE